MECYIGKVETPNGERENRENSRDFTVDLERAKTSEGKAATVDLSRTRRRCRKKSGTRLGTPDSEVVRGWSGACPAEAKSATRTAESTDVGKIAVPENTDLEYRGGDVERMPLNSFRSCTQEEREQEVEVPTGSEEGQERQVPNRLVKRNSEMNGKSKFFIFIIAFSVIPSTESIPAKKVIFYSTREDMPPNVHYILEVDETKKHREKELSDTIKLSCVPARKAETGKPEGEEAYVGGPEKCVKKSEIITAPSRTNGGGGDCSGRKRRKDLNGLCRKVWD
ncbi:UNVERIFIED_CONTAM: hypothetical protein PYX00_008869 [Menopon gallinae]|uniref:Uncharacterized protein n=1 Tax=Menopon gallinae TaxID=328185 RepID=A0AAW2H993_9NEOP